MIYLYTVGAYGYEEHITKHYYSHNKHTQKEFNETVFKVLKQLMEDILEDKPTSVCFPNIFFEADDLLLEEKFDKLMQENGFNVVSNQVVASVNFTLKLDTDNDNNKKLTDLFLQLDIDESCKEKNCNRIKDLDTKEREYLKNECGVAIREHHRRIKI